RDACSQPDPSGPARVHQRELSPKVFLGACLVGGGGASSCCLRAPIHLLSFDLLQNDEGSTHEKLDFKLHFSCASYLITTPCYSDAFAKLLESGDLHMSSIKVDGISISFQHLLAKICFHHHFSVVERVDSCASMYSRSIQGHHVCLLVKKGENSVSIDGKCNDSTLLSNLLDEMKETLSKC
uniref:AP-3 complex subunit delta Mu C-terminal domain-containing protein n=1 Tax=Amazona collaria TaxID=241587 RepID=A0A8B9FZJ2_9PSIT